jgi:hypothetical protein
MQTESLRIRKTAILSGGRRFEKIGPITVGKKLEW